MSEFSEALAAIDALPPLTKRIEDMVHKEGIEVEWVARRLRLQIADVRQHLDVARSARQVFADLVTSRPDYEDVEPISDEQLTGRFVDVVRMVREGLLPHEIALRLGIEKDSALNYISEARKMGVQNLPSYRGGKWTTAQPSDRLGEVVALASAGKTPAEIACELEIAPCTVSWHLGNARSQGIELPPIKRGRPTSAA